MIILHTHPLKFVQFVDNDHVIQQLEDTDHTFISFCDYYPISYSTVDCVYLLVPLTTCS